MSIWSKLIGIKKTEDRNNAIGNKITSVPFSAPNYAIVDVEVGLKDHKIHDHSCMMARHSIKLPKMNCLVFFVI